MNEYDGIVLYSGGLDSILAYRVLADQELKLLAVKFHTFFFPLPAGEEEYIRDQKEKYNVEIELHEVTEEFLPVVRNPQFGYGRWMNPCLDCKLFMYNKLVKVMKRTGAKFIATGEVIGQRPMTQHRGELNKLAKESGLSGKILRPLSAKLLQETEVERSGVVDRARLLDISGRGRRWQMRLAGEKGITGYPTPAGGCHLTDEACARRLKDMFIHGEDTRALPLLQTGRHFRLSETCRLTVGRNHEENLLIESHAGNADALLVPVSHMGPSAIAHGSCTKSELDAAAEIIARYGDASPEELTLVELRVEGLTRQGKFEPCEDADIKKLRI
jgi:tRNA U34 2-thiouridine synthase MnmA/TrmU